MVAGRRPVALGLVCQRLLPVEGSHKNIMIITGIWGADLLMSVWQRENTVMNMPVCGQRAGMLTLVSMRFHIPYVI